MMYVRYPLSLRQVEDLLCERGIDICHETVRYWWNRFGPVFAAEIRKRRVHHRFYSLWRWHLDEVFVRINGKTHYLWRAVDHEGEVVEVFVTKRRDRRASRRTPPATGPARSGMHVAYGAPRRHTMPSAPAVVKRGWGWPYFSQPICGDDRSLCSPAPSPLAARQRPESPNSLGNWRARQDSNLRPSA